MKCSLSWEHILAYTVVLYVKPILRIWAILHYWKYVYTLSLGFCSGRQSEKSFPRHPTTLNMRQNHYAVGARLHRLQRLRNNFFHSISLHEVVLATIIVYRLSEVTRDMHLISLRKCTISPTYFNLNIFPTEECLKLFHSVAKVLKLSRECCRVGGTRGTAGTPVVHLLLHASLCAVFLPQCGGLSFRLCLACHFKWCQRFSCSHE